MGRFTSYKFVVILLDWFYHVPLLHRNFAPQVGVRIYWTDHLTSLQKRIGTRTFLCRQNIWHTKER